MFLCTQSVFKPRYGLCNMLLSHLWVVLPLLFMSTIEGPHYSREWEGYLSLVPVLSDVPKDKGREIQSILPSLEGTKPI